MAIALTALIAVLFALPSPARENKPFNTVNGRTTTNAAPRGAVVHFQGGAAANGPLAGQAPAVTGAMISGTPSDGGRAFMGGGRQAVSRGSSSRSINRGGKAFWGGSRKVAVEPAPTEEEAPPNYSKPGALIRTTGQQPVYEKAEARTHTVDAGEIVFNKRKGIDVGRAPSVQHGPKDTLPPPNPGTGGGTYSGGAAANSGSGSGSSGGSSGGGHDNNGSGNNGKDKPGDDDDGHGGDKHMTTSFYDAF